MSIKFTLGGVTVEQRKFKEFPSYLAARAQAALEARATTVAASIAAAYPIGKTGGLQSGVIVRSQPRKTKARVLLVHKLRRALAWEYGTKDRYTKKTKAYRGFIARTPPPGKNFVPKIMQARIDLVPRIAALMRAEGLTVSGG